LHEYWVQLAGQHDAPPELEEMPPELDEPAPEPEERPPEPEELPELELDGLTPELDPLPELIGPPPEPDKVTGALEPSRSPIGMNVPLQPAVVQTTTPAAVRAKEERETNVRVMTASS
jgi:hypothetical protein